MGQKEYKDITELIAEKLKAHKAPYREGAWEQFQQKSGRTRRPLWPWLSAAAAAILVGSFLLIKLNQENTMHTEPAMVKQSGNIEAPHSLPSPESPVHEPETRGVSDQHENATETELADLEPASEKKQAPTHLAYLESPKTETLESKDTGLDSDKKLQSFSRQGKTTRIAETPEHRQEKSAADAGQQQTLLSSAKPIDPPLPGAQRESAWSFGVSVAPVMSEDNVNMGGGIEVSYQLARNLSIRTGVSYMELDAHKNMGENRQAMMDSPTGHTAMFLPSKTLNSVSTSVSGIDIPVNLEYHINDRFFASAGISVFNVIKENRTHHFRSQIQELSYSKASTNSLVETPQPVIKTVYSTERAQQRPYEERSLTGFVNFSVGYKLPVLDRLNLSIEPFYKIPVKGRSMQDMDLTNGGIRISAGF